jgi:hypothetical protein
MASELDKIVSDNQGRGGEGRQVGNKHLYTSCGLRCECTSVAECIVANEC